MRGADARAQRLGVAGEWLMEQAGAAVAATAMALLSSAGRARDARILVLCGAGQQRRRRARGGAPPRGRGLALRGRPARDRERADDDGRPPELAPPRRRRGRVALPRPDAPTTRRSCLNGIERAGLVIDALLGTGVRGTLREPIRSGVDVAVRAASSGVPVLAVDGPTALDLSSGEPSIPVVRADVTVTFHRPKRGLLAGRARPLVGRVLVAPIGIPLEADLG